jgi:Diadenosine tetraphosphate (Ap4A) hydrolase and other HIT family hydrolases
MRYTIIGDDMDCIFCKIVNGDIPCYKIYEDLDTLAFLDIADDLYGHTLVIPKKHYKNILDIDNDVLNKVMSTVKKVSNHYVNDLGFDGVNLMNANEEEAQQSVFHLHFHVLPRKKDDNLDLWPLHGNLGNDLSEVCENLKFKEE